MKNTLIIAVFMAAFLCLNAQQHPENCPLNGREDCTGYCGEFEDKNGDGFCDFAILSSEKQENANPKPANPPSVTDKKQEPEKLNPQTKGITSESETTISPTTNTLEQTQEKSKTPANYQQYFWYTLFGTILLYLLSWLMVKMEKIKKVSHRKIWNTLLLLTFIVSGLLGIYVAFAKVCSMAINYRLLMIYHVNFGISMTVISVAHILWHWKYFKNLVKGANK